MSAGTLSVQMVTPAVMQARVLGVAVDDLVAAHGLSAGALADPDTRIPFETVTALWDAIAGRVGTPDFGLAAAKAISPGHFDLHEYLIRCSPTLADGLRRAFQFMGLLTTRGVWVVDVDPGDDEMRIINRPPAVISRHGHEFALLTMLAIIRRAAGRSLALRRLELMELEPDDTSPLRDAFQCPIMFGCAANAMIFPADLASLALPARDDKLLALIERHATWMTDELGDDQMPVADRARRAIFHLFQREAMTLDRVARSVGMSARSLQRQLRSESTSFRQLVDDVRREIAISHVKAGKTPIGTIAHLLDFSDTSAFHRSFRRWTGQSPSEFRNAAKA